MGRFTKRGNSMQLSFTFRGRHNLLSQNENKSQLTYRTGRPSRASAMLERKDHGRMMSCFLNFILQECIHIRDPHAGLTARKAYWVSCPDTPGPRDHLSEWRLRTAAHRTVIRRLQIRDKGPPQPIGAGAFGPVPFMISRETWWAALLEVTCWAKGRLKGKVLLGSIKGVKECTSWHLQTASCDQWSWTSVAKTSNAREYLPLLI